VRLSGRRDRGSAAVETALVLPILLLIVFGIVDFGRMLNAQITLTEAAREGARAVALDSAWEGRVDAATQTLGGLGAVDPDPGEECGPSPDLDQDAVFEVHYTFSFITPVGALAGLFSGDGFGGDVSMSGQGVMPCRA
jgi:hypothetical protein